MPLPAPDASTFTQTAVPPPAASENIHFVHLSQEDGLSQSSVLTIYQDSKGYMWFGTLNGLNKYDGYRFTVYEHDPDDPYSLSDNVVQAIFEDRAGTLWLGTAKGGLNKFDRVTEQFTVYRHDPHDPGSLSSDEVTAVAEDHTGTLWVAAFDGGLNRYDPASDRFVRYQHNRQDRHTLSSNKVWSLLVDARGWLWVGTADGGLNRYDPHTGYFIHYRHDRDDIYSLSHDAVSAIYEDAQGRLWVGTYGGGFNQFDHATNRFQRFQYDPRFPYSLAGNKIITIRADLTGALWLGVAGKGVDRFEVADGRFTHYPHTPGSPGSLSGNQVLSLYVDRSGVVWIGTDGAGLNMHDPGKRLFWHYRPDAADAHSLNGGSVSAILEDHLGILWIGTESGLSKLYRRTNHVTHYQTSLSPGKNDGVLAGETFPEVLPAEPQGDLTLFDHARGQATVTLSDNRVQAILEDSQGQIWVGTQGGLNVIERPYGRAIVYRHQADSPASLMHDWVWAMYEDSRGHLWVGTAVGLDRFDPATGHFTHFKHDPTKALSISPGDVRAIVEDHTGALWVATASGLNHFLPSTGTFYHYRHDPADPASLGDDVVLSLYVDSAGVLWAGTYSGGLNKLDRQTGTFTRYLKKHGLPSNAVYGILEDDAGHLWLSTNSGLSRFNPQTETFTNYDARDGLQSSEFNANAYHKSSSGEMFFGGVNGFNAFYPAHIVENPYVPPVVLTTLTQSGEAITVDGAVDSLTAVTLRWPHNFFEFEFAALSYAQADKNQYAYRLEGLEAEWNYVGSRPFGRYTNLPGGVYTLHIKGANSDGVWNEVGLALPVRVVPPFWQTWWFRLVTAVLLLGGVLAGYRLRVAAIQAHNRQLQQQVAERTHTLAQHAAELERRRKIAEGLRDVLVLLNSHQPLSESLQYIVCQAAAVANAAQVVIFRHQAAGGALVMAHSSGCYPDEALGPYLPLLEAQWARGSAEHGRPLLLADLAAGSSPGAKDGYGALLGVPLYVGGTLYGGVIWFYAYRRHFTTEDVELGFTFADQAALAIGNDWLRAQVEETAVMMERNRLARDLHDAVTQTLFSASLIAEVLPETWVNNPPKGQRLLRELTQLTRGAMAEMRTLLLELRPSALAEADMDILLKQLGQTVTGRTGMAVTVNVADGCRLPPKVHETFYRVAQEACNNIVKHAHASQVTINLVWAERRAGETHGSNACLRITDDGCGFRPTAVAADRLGIPIMYERAEAVGAAFTLNSQPGRGTEIALCWRE